MDLTKDCSAIEYWVAFLDIVTVKFSTFEVNLRTLISPIMTTYGQAEFEALGLLKRIRTTSVRVSSTITNHPDMLTDKELEVDRTNLCYLISREDVV